MGTCEAGKRNGASWANAWGDVGDISWAALSPGDTVWIAAGSYGVLTPGKSGTGDSDTAGSSSSGPPVTTTERPPVGAPATTVR